jgi:hypothetical protein
MYGDPAGTQQIELMITSLYAVQSQLCDVLNTALLRGIPCPLENCCNWLLSHQERIPLSRDPDIPNA